MISNERTWPHQRKLNRQPGYNSPARQPWRPFVQEDILKTAELQIERKQFSMTLKENPRGRYLRISEEAAGRRNTIIIPANGLMDFQKQLEEMLNATGDIPQKNPPPEI